VSPEAAGRPTGFTCPTCGGPLRETREPPAWEFRCRIGHGFSGGGLLAGHASARLASLEHARARLSEGAALKRHLAEDARQVGRDHTAARLEEEAARLDAQLQALEALEALGPGGPW
jgi:two-component system chemotaxis response regulator CheB